MRLFLPNKSKLSIKKRPDLFYNKGLIYYKMKNYTNAIEYFSKALKLFEITPSGSASIIMPMTAQNDAIILPNVVDGYMSF